jgi:hypothetical protein
LQGKIWFQPIRRQKIFPAKNRSPEHGNKEGEKRKEIQKINKIAKRKGAQG